MSRPRTGKTEHPKARRVPRRIGSAGAFQDLDFLCFSLSLLRFKAVRSARRGHRTPPAPGCLAPIQRFPPRHPPKASPSDGLVARTGRPGSPPTVRGQTRVQRGRLRRAGGRLLGPAVGGGCWPNNVHAASWARRPRLIAGDDPRLLGGEAQGVAQAGVPWPWGPCPAARPCPVSLVLCPLSCVPCPAAPEHSLL